MMKPYLGDDVEQEALLHVAVLNEDVQHVLESGQLRDELLHHLGLEGVEGGLLKEAFTKRVMVCYSVL